MNYRIPSLKNCFYEKNYLLLLSAFILIIAFRGETKISITENVKDENANPVVEA